MQEISASIDAVYDEMRALVESHAGKPGLREKLRPLREELRALQAREAEEIAERYDAHFRPKYEKALELIGHARQALGKR
jgi:hypothetical protein